MKNLLIQQDIIFAILSCRQKSGGNIITDISAVYNSEYPIQSYFVSIYYNSTHFLSTTEYDHSGQMKQSMHFERKSMHRLFLCQIIQRIIWHKPKELYEIIFNDEICSFGAGVQRTAIPLCKIQECNILCRSRAAALPSSVAFRHLVLGILLDANSSKESASLFKSFSWKFSKNGGTSK